MFANLDQVYNVATMIVNRLNEVMLHGDNCLIGSVFVEKVRRLLPGTECHADDRDFAVES